jgi:hypothetical protein
MNSINMNQLAGFTALALAIGVVGCAKQDEGPPYANVSGTVMYSGKPLPKGQITFSCDGRPPSPMDIVDGKFAGQAMVGSNQVSVAAFRKATKERAIPKEAQAQYKAYQALNKSGGGGTLENFDPSMEDYIPDEWGKNSTQVRVVKAGAANEFQFNIKGR